MFSELHDNQYEQAANVTALTAETNKLKKKITEKTELIGKLRSQLDRVTGRLKKYEPDFKVKIAEDEEMKENPPGKLEKKHHKSVEGHHHHMNIGSVWII